MSNVLHCELIRLTVLDLAVGGRRDLIRRVFDGSALRLITTAITQDQATPEEIERLQAALSERAGRE